MVRTVFTCRSYIAALGIFTFTFSAFSTFGTAGVSTRAVTLRPH
jgi:hypothetical protein